MERRLTAQLTQRSGRLRNSRHLHVHNRSRLPQRPLDRRSSTRPWPTTLGFGRLCAGHRCYGYLGCTAISVDLDGLEPRQNGWIARASSIVHYGITLAMLPGEKLAHGGLTTNQC
jgi:hypothetical protein